MKKLIAVILVLCVLSCDVACAGCWKGDQWVEDAYVLCRQYSLVNIRKGPSKNAAVIPGLMDCGSKVYLDGKKKGEWLHCVFLTLEYSEGWIHEGYVSLYEPELVEKDAVIKSNGRVAVRKSVNGKRIKWAKPNQKVKVEYYSMDWCITNIGYIQSDYIEFIEE